MAKVAQTPLQKQIHLVTRRLFLQTFLDCLLVCWTIALVVAAIWFFVQPYLIENPPSWLRLGVAGGFVGLSTVIALALGYVRTPAKLAAALLLDEKFNLKERVTTCLTLQPDQKLSPAGLALLADVNTHLEKLDVGPGFPLRASWWGSMVPTVAAILAVAAFFYEPPSSQALTTKKEDKKDQPVANAAEIEKKIEKLKKQEKRQTEKGVSEELKRIEAELDQIANRPHTTKEQLKDRIKEMTDLEDRMKNREKEQAEKNRSMKQQLQQMEKMAGKSDGQEGPAKNLQKALSEGKFDKAKEEMERLTKKLKEGTLTKKEEEQLSKQLKKLQENLDKMAQQKDKEEMLKQLNKEGKLDAEALKRELKQLKDDSEKLKDLKNLANQLAQAQQELKEGNKEAAAKGLQAAADKLGNMDMDDQNLQDLRDQLQKLQDAKEESGKGEGGGQMTLESDQFKRGDTDEMNDGNPGAGKRPLGEKKPFKSYETKVKGQMDKGKIVFDGFAPGPNFRRKSTSEIAGDIKQASQEAPEAIEQQKIPKAARDMAKGYFRNLGGNETKKDGKP